MTFFNVAMPSEKLQDILRNTEGQINFYDTQQSS